MPSIKTAGFRFEFNFTDLHAVSGLHVDETRYHEEPSAADTTRILAYYVHITVTQPVFFSQPSRCFSTEKILQHSFAKNHYYLLFKDS